ncbi:MAG: hypothetical protein TECD_01154 [Hyphomicrobiaceae bacterium hypho_1]
MPKRQCKEITKLDSNFKGQLLIAMPSISSGFFHRSAIFSCAHSKDGAMGLIINLPTQNIAFANLLEQLEIINEKNKSKVPSNILDRKVYIGGPISTTRGFVLHTPDYLINSSSIRFQNNICLTSTIDILKAISINRGPQYAFMALGYVGWRPGQLETEFANNNWLNCQSYCDLIFDDNVETKYKRALSKLGISLEYLSAEAGHA